MSSENALSDAAGNYSGVWGNRIGFGRRPVLLVVDFAKAYTEKDSPLFASGVGPAFGDRHPDPHRANLFDIDSKYGDVVGKNEVLAHFETVASS